MSKFVKSNLFSKFRMFKSIIVSSSFSKSDKLSRHDLKENSSVLFDEYKLHDSNNSSSLSDLISSNNSAPLYVSF